MLSATILEINEQTIIECNSNNVFLDCEKLSFVPRILHASGNLCISYTSLRQKRGYALRQRKRKRLFAVSYVVAQDIKFYSWVHSMTREKMEEIL